RRRSALGEAVRGSGALPGFADIVVELRYYRRTSSTDRRRRLFAQSRYGDTPRQRVIEWTADGSDYLSLGTPAEAAFGDAWKVLEPILMKAPHKLNREQIRKRWPGGRAPRDSTVYQWLEVAVERGLVGKDGKGRRRSPLRYWLPHK